MCVYMCACVRACVSVCTCVYVNACIHISVLVCVCVHLHLSVCAVIYNRVSTLHTGASVKDKAGQTAEREGRLYSTSIGTEKKTKGAA